LTTAGAERRALRPLWTLTTGAVIGALASPYLPHPAPQAEACILATAGCAAALVGMLDRRWWAVWFLAGFGLVGGHGILAADQNGYIRRLASSDRDIALRTEVLVVSGWEPTRWGWRASVRVRSATADGRPLRFRGRQSMEVRRATTLTDLPAPGSVAGGLVSLRGDDRRALLVAASPAVFEMVRPARGTAAVRQLLVDSLLASAGTDVGRIRSAELAAALALGRRDVLPRDRRDGWRRSGLAHLLAVSGLHVGLVAGMAWLGLSCSGIHPRTARWAMLVTLPVYTVIAGASPSAVRATLMAMAFLIGRQLGRSIIPIASVLMVTSSLLAARPDLVHDAGFQLTVGVTAALVRWVPTVAVRCPGPGWLAGLLAVPVVAQLAAAPMVAFHFRTAVPGAVMSNLAVPLVLGPTLASALLATVLSPVWPSLAALVLDVTGQLESVLWLCSRPGRVWELVLPSLPAVALAVLAIAGWIALQPGRPGTLGAVGWLSILGCLVCWWVVRPVPDTPRVELLPVADGLAATLTTPSGILLLDGGRWQRQATELLMDGPARSLDAVVLSHADEDHTGGIPLVLRTMRVGRLIMPRWMGADPRAVPLLRCARRRQVPVTRVTRGTVITLPGVRLETVWPPIFDAPAKANERSLAARLQFEAGSVLLTSDIGSATERLFLPSGAIPSTILIVPHHGSRHSACDAFLDAVSPRLALIPAGPLNRYHHPHQEVLDRLRARGIPHRFPKRDGRCGAVYAGGEWNPYP